MLATTPCSRPSNLQFIQEPSKRPDAILVEPVGTGMAQIARAAVGAGIAWGIINTNVDYIPELRQHALVPVFSVQSDHEAIGKLQGQQMGALLGEKGCVLYIEGPSVRDVAKMRSKGCWPPSHAASKSKLSRVIGHKTAAITRSSRGCRSALRANCTSA